MIPIENRIVKILSEKEFEFMRRRSTETSVNRFDLMKDVSIIRDKAYKKPN